MFELINNPVVFLVLFIMAAWRMSSLLVAEDGPFLMFRHFRTLVGISRDEQTGTVFVSNTFAEALTCIWCTSIYVVAGLLALLYFVPPVANVLVLWCSVSTGVILIQKRIDRV